MTPGGTARVAGDGAGPGTFAAAMNAADAVLWSIERDPELRSTVTAVALLDRAPDRAALRQRVAAVVAALPRFRQRAVEPPLGLGHPRWEEDPDVDLEFHLRTVAAPAPGDTQWVLDFAASLAEAGFDRSRPLWELVVVEGLAEGRAALVQKIHHSLTDGVGGVELMVRMLDWERHPRREPPLDRVDAPPVPPGWTRLARRGLELPRVIAGTPRALSRAVSAGPAGAWRTAGSVARVLAPGGDRRSPVLVGHSTAWRFAVAEESMAAVRRAAAATEGTVNDVFVAAIAGGLHRYHRAHGHQVAALRLTLPVSLRRPGDPLGGNRFTPVRFTLPIAEPDPAIRVRQVGELCRSWRQEPALPLTDAIAAALTLLPPAATTAVMGSLLKGIDVVATNVPGVPVRCYVGGAELLREYAFAPLSGAALNVALVSHVDTACIGVNMDRAAVSDPEVLMACLAEAIAELVALGRHDRKARKPWPTTQS